MKKKFLLVVLCLLCVVCFATGLIACNDDTQTTKHIHKYNDGWSYDSFTHWHECSGGVNCNMSRIDEGKHVDVDKDELCDVCGATFAYAHNLTLVPPKTATCTEEGNIEYYACSSCDLWFADAEGKNIIENKNSVIIPKDIHLLSLHSAIGATCMAGGNKEYYECSKCHKYFNDDKGEDEIVDKDSVNLAIVDHDIIFVPQADATCTEDGNSAYYECEFCHKYFNDESGENEIVDHESVKTQKISHTLTFVSELVATCEHDGHSAYYECGACHKFFVDSEGVNEIVDKDSVNTAKVAHTLDLVEYTAPSCSTKGNVAYYECSVCHKYFRDSEGATLIEDKESVILAERHELTHVSYLAPTCTTAGNREYYECDVCHAYFSDYEGANEIVDKSSILISANGHNFSSGVCTVCGVKKPTEGLSYEDCGEYSALQSIGSASYESSLVVADEYNGKPVTHIKENALKDKTYFTSIILPDTITTIGDYAFYGTKISSITLPESVTTIGASAFENSRISTINIPSNVTSIGDRAFQTTSVKNIKLPEGLTSIGASTFYDCSALRSITLPASLTSIGENAFHNCYNLYTIIYKGDLAGWCAISGLDTFMRNNVGNVTNPRRVSVDGQDLTDEIVIPDGVTSIGNGAFAWCTSVWSITLPEGVQRIGDYAFDNSGIVRINIPESVTTIGARAFNDCEKLSTISLPNSVASIGEWAFYGCKELENITLGNGLKSIGANAFTDCYKLSSINIPDSVTSIGEQAFSSCKALTSIAIPNNVATIESWTFNYCSNLKSIIIPVSVTSVGEYAFSSCNALTAIYYCGTEEEWNAIAINASGNSQFTSTTHYYYSETQPETEGNFWHYDVDGVTPVAW